MKTLLEEEEKNSPEIREHEVVKGKVVLVNKSEAFIDIGYKQEIPVPKKELAYPEPDSAEDVVKVGDEIDVYIVSLGGENGGLLSKVKADRMAAWKDMEGVKERGETVEAKIQQVVKGGLVASVNGLRGFIPASQMELHFVKDLSIYVGQTVEALPIEIDVRKQRLVLSRRQLLEAEREKKQEEVFATLEAGQTVHGTVKRLVDYGAFIDIGGVDGLAHISDLAWHRVSKPSDVLHVGQHDAAPSEARKQVHKWAQIGQSTHDEADIARSLADKAVNYLTVGPVYATSPDPRYAPPGLDLVRTAARLCPPGDPSSKPWFAVGGIEPGTVDEVLAAGARRVAVVGAITRADDPEAAARALARRVRKAWDDDPAMEKVALGAFGGGMSFKTT